ncbi:MAG TPA: hypothetical protein VN843_11495 [Anaerolineales bacterium]|nr:hypothetical protein [Anaerolineales bacterium]
MEQNSDMIQLPDGSGFFIGSFPLSKDHWLYQPTPEVWDEKRDCSLDTPVPVLDQSLRSAVKTAVRYGLRAATMNGKVTDFDPDALVLNICYALCGSTGVICENRPDRSVEI